MRHVHSLEREVGPTFLRGHANFPVLVEFSQRLDLSAGKPSLSGEMTVESLGRDARPLKEVLKLSEGQHLGADIMGCAGLHVRR
jgi:hypothetical protein